MSADRHDHQPEDDHLDNITGLSSCPRLKLSASSSADGTIRIWNQLNQIVRYALHQMIYRIVVGPGGALTYSWTLICLLLTL